MRQYVQASLLDPQLFAFRCGRLQKAFELALTLSVAQERPAYVLGRGWDPMNTRQRYAAALRMELADLVAEGYRVIARVDSRLRWKAPRRERSRH